MQFGFIEFSSPRQVIRGSGKVLWRGRPRFKSRAGPVSAARHKIKRRRHEILQPPTKITKAPRRSPEDESLGRGKVAEKGQGGQCPSSDDYAVRHLRSEPP